MKSINFNRFFYSNLLILGVHLGGQKNKIRKDVNNFAMCEYNNFYCLDIKQSFKN
jgi:ribosomal protein S2